MTTARLTSIVGAGLLCFAAMAQDKPAGKEKQAGPAMEMPKPAPEMKDLRALIGTWSSDEKMEPSPWMPSGGTSAGTSVVRAGPGGFSVTMDHSSKGVMGVFRGHGVLTWDANDKVYKFAWVDSMTPGMMVETGRKEGADLIFKGEAMMMGKKVAIRDVFSDFTPASYTLTSYMNDGSGEKKMMTIKFTKKEAPAAKK